MVPDERVSEPRGSALNRAATSRGKLDELERAESNAAPCPQYKLDDLSAKMVSSKCACWLVFLICPLTSMNLTVHYKEVPEGASPVLWVIVIGCMVNVYFLSGFFLFALGRFGGKHGILSRLKDSSIKAAYPEKLNSAELIDDNDEREKAVEAVLEELRPVKISEAAKKSLDRWHRPIAFLSVVCVIITAIGLWAPITDPERNIYKDPLLVDVAWDPAGVVAHETVHLWAMFVIPLALSWLSQLFIAATVADDAVTEVIHKIAALRPDDPLALIDLIVANEGPVGASGEPEQEEQLREELEAMRLSALKRRASEAGVSDAKIKKLVGNRGWEADVERATLALVDVRAQQLPAHDPAPSRRLRLPAGDDGDSLRRIFHRHRRGLDCVLDGFLRLFRVRRRHGWRGQQHPRRAQHPHLASHGGCAAAARTAAGSRGHEMRRSSGRPQRQGDAPLHASSGVP